MTSTNDSVYLLIGDIGGTNSRLSLYDPSSDVPIVVETYQNAKMLTNKSDGAFELLILQPFLRHCWEQAKPMTPLAPIEECEIVCCLACAGPVQDNKVRMSNLGVTIDGDAIQSHSSSDHVYISKIKRALIINDFVAQGYGCLTLKPDEVIELVHAKVDPVGPKVCVGAGTGLGECYLTPNGDDYVCYPSEGGHVEFNPRSDIEIKMRKSLMVELPYCAHRISVERVVSGIGLANAYAFLAREYPEQRDEKVYHEFFLATDMKAKVVSDNAAIDKLCKMAIDIMISAYGSEAGSAALKWIPTGGLYLTGGITPKMIDYIKGDNSEFMKAYKDKGRVSQLLDRIPLFAVMEEDLGLRMCRLEYKRLRSGVTM